MLSIVGTRIYMHEGDDCSFKIVYRDKNDRIFNFNPEDMLTLTIRDRNTRDIILVKTSNSFDIDEEICSIFIFESSDASILSHGDYIYDLVIDTSTGSRHTLIDNANFNVLENTTLNPLGDEFTPHRIESLESVKSISLSESPLICNFNYIQVKKKEIPGSLITFDESVLDLREEDTGEDNPDDSLILFSEDEENEENEDGTIVLF